MKSLLKITAAALGFLVLLLAAGIFYITSIMDPNDYKPRIEQAALERAGIVLNIEGDINWSLYPWLGMETGTIRISYPDKPELARLESSQVSLQLIPLLSARVEMSDILLNGLSVNLIKDADGNVNWQSQTPLATQTDQQELPTDATESDSSVDSLEKAIRVPDLDIASINIQRARIDYTDLSSNSRLELSEVEFTTGRIAQGASLPIELVFNFRQFEGTETLIEAKNRLTTKVDLSNDLQTFSLNDLLIQSTIRGSKVPANLPELTIQSQLKLDLPTEQVNFEALQLSFGGIDISGNLLINDFTTIDINGAINIADVNLKAFMNQLGQPLPELQDDNVLTSVALNTDIQGNLEKLEFNSLAINLDDTELIGNLGFNLTSGHISLALKGNHINVDRYLPVSTSASSAGSGSSAASSSTTETTTGWPRDEVIPLETLRHLNLSITLDMEGITIAEQNLGQPSILFTAKDGLLNLERLITQVYSGSVNASGNLDARNDTAQTQFNAQLDSIQIGELLQAVAETDIFSGLFNASADISTSGQSINAMINSLNGRANIEMKEGVLEGISMAQTLCQGIQTVTALGINPQQVDRSTPFADLSGNFSIRNGVVENNDLTAMLDAMRLSAQGQVNLPDQSIDYRLGFTIIDNLFQQSCSVNNRLEGLELPINCKGQFDTPPAQMCRPDTSVFTQLLKREVQRQVEERIGGSVEEQIRERLGGEEGARSLIRGLLR